MRASVTPAVSQAFRQTAQQDQNYTASRSHPSRPETPKVRGVGSPTARRVLPSRSEIPPTVAGGSLAAAPLSRLASAFLLRGSFLLVTGREGRMAGDARVAGLEDFLADRGEALLQAALERLLRHWRKVEGDPEGYLRRTIYNLAADGWRRQRRWRARLPLLHGADDGIVPDHSEQVGQRDELVRLLVRLPPGQRAAIVLRYCEDLTDDEAAKVLGCPVGPVRLATSRGLPPLR